MGTGTALALDLAISYLNHAMKMNELVAKANAEGREVDVEDVKKLAAKNDAKAKEIFGD